MCAFTHETGRQAGILVDRRGSVTHVMVGTAREIEMPDWGRIRAGRGRLRARKFLGPVKCFACLLECGEFASTRECFRQLQPTKSG